MLHLTYYTRSHNFLAESKQKPCSISHIHISTMEKLVEATVDLKESSPVINNGAVAEDQLEVEASNPPKSTTNILKKPAVTPDRLKVPKAFKYPERYTSPTDLMMSPISRGLLARSKRATVPVPLALPLPLPP